MCNGVSMNLFLRVPCLQCMGCCSPHITAPRPLPAQPLSPGTCLRGAYRQTYACRFNRSNIAIHIQVDVFAFAQQVIHHINQCGHAPTVRLEHLGCQLLMTGQTRTTAC